MTLSNEGDIHREAQKGRPARPQRARLAQVEVKVERISDLLDLSISRNLPITPTAFFSILPEGE